VDVQIQTSPAPKKTSRLRDWSRRLLITSLCLGACTCYVLWVGLNALGAGHGTATIWYGGLVLWFVSWVVLLASCVTGLVSWKQTSHLPFWVAPSLLVLAVVTGLGIWGLGG
jgi:hypothetical protein